MRLRLIDADELKSCSDITNWDEPYGCSFNEIDSQPTAYDVDEIVERLEEIRWEILNDTTYDNDIVNYYLEYVDSMIEAVRSGIKESRNGKMEIINRRRWILDTEITDIEQAIEYFKDELSTMNVFSDMVSFKENDRKSIETALNVLQKVYEENQNRQQDGSR